MSELVFWNWKMKIDFADVFLEPFDAIAAKNEPYLERPETAAQTQMPVSIINDGASIFLMSKWI
jgi:hypothetical protein